MAHSVFDTKRFLRTEFDSPAGLVAFLTAFGVQCPSVEVVAKWFQRASVPSAWLPVLLAYKELDGGVPVSMSQYLVGGEA